MNVKMICSVYFCFLLLLITGCQLISSPQHIPDLKEHQTVVDFTMRPPKYIPGRVHVLLANELWKKEFVAKNDNQLPRGIERLNLSPELKRIFDCYPVEQIWRSLPTLERPLNGKIQVINYAERMTLLWEKKKKRNNARPYNPPKLTEMMGSFELKFQKDIDMEALLEALKNVPGILSAEAVAVPNPQDSYMPDDPGWVDPSDEAYDIELARGRWGFHNTGDSLGPDYLEDFDINAPQAWYHQQGDPELTVAVFDDCFDVTHEDLYKNIFLNNGEVPSNIVTLFKGASSEDGLPEILTFYDLNEVISDLDTMGWKDMNGNGYIDGEDVSAWWGSLPDGYNANTIDDKDSDGDGILNPHPDDDGNGYIDDLVGWNFHNNTHITFEVGTGKHGTRVAGLIAAITDNKTGVVGASPRVRILPVVSSSHINKIDYAKSFSEVKIINDSNSYIFMGSSQSGINELLKTLEPEGIIYIASYGNHGAFFNGFDPSNREPVVSISNFGHDGKRVSDSNFGFKNDVAAPGKGMSSLDARKETATNSNATIGFGGTSASAPVAAGVAALIMSQDSTLSPEQVRQIIRMTASDPIAVEGDNGENTPGWDIFSGWGLINAENAINAVINETIYPEANILSLPMNYISGHREEGFAIYEGNIPIHAYIGLPNGDPVNWTLKRGYKLDMSDAINIADQEGVGYIDGTSSIHTLNSDLLLQGRHVLELEVTTSEGISGKDRAVIDLPRAYFSNLKKGDLIIEPLPIEGFAYGPLFIQYQVLIAPGWSPQSSDFETLLTSTSAKKPELPSEPGIYLETAETLLEELDIFSLPVILPNSGEATIRVSTTANAPETGGTKVWNVDEQVIIDITQPLTYPGFPFNNNAVFIYFAGAPTASDLNGDGSQELILTGNHTYEDDGKITYKKPIHILQADGTPLPGWPVELPEGNISSIETVAVGDINKDGRSEIVVLSRRIQKKPSNQWCIRVFDHHGIENQNGWPIELTPPWPFINCIEKQFYPVLADVTLDGSLEILIPLQQNLPEILLPEIRAFYADGSIAQTYTAGPPPSRISQPAVGDIDGDGENEIVAIAYTKGSSNGPARLYAWNCDSSLLWSNEFDDYSDSDYASPVLVDIDEDGLLEIIIGTVSEGLIAFETDGTPLFNSNTEYHLYRRPVVAQFCPSNPTYEPMIISSSNLGSLIEGTVYTNIEAVHALTGEPPPEWSDEKKAADGRSYNHPIVADITGDNCLEVIAGNSYQANGYLADVDLSFYLKLFDANGNEISDEYKWPLNYLNPVAACPLVTDLDNDNDLELVVQTQGYKAKIYAYDLDTPAGPGSVAWGEFGHDPRNSSNYHGGLRILSPTTAHSETIHISGDPFLSSLILIRVRFSRHTPLNDITPSAWKVSLDQNEAETKEITRVQGEHWLLVAPIPDLPADAYDLYVEFNDGGIKSWDRYRDAVVYAETPANNTQIAVIDRSGSMGLHNKMASTHVAARFFTESAYPEDEIGVVSFNTEATDDLGAGVVTAQENWGNIADTITGLTAGGRTSIGAGISKALEILNAHANPENNWALLLMTDGLENTEPFWNQEGITQPPVKPAVEALKANHPQFAIHTVALGPDADQNLLQNISKLTAGTFYPVYLGNSLSLFNRLADVFHYSREKIAGSQRLLTHGDTYRPGSSWGDSIFIPPGTRHLQIGLNWDKECICLNKDNTKKNIPLMLEIIRPDGTALTSDIGTSITENRTDKVITIFAPTPGQWQVNISNNASCPEIEALLTVSAVMPTQIKTLLGPTDKLTDGTPFSTLLAFAIHKDNLLRKTKFSVSVTRPDKSVYTVNMNDAGKKGDDISGDGIFTAHLPWILPGSYLIQITAYHENNKKMFTISETMGFYNQLGSDADSDGLPDQWEQTYATPCHDGLLPNKDNDKDGLTNIMEWRFQSNPRRFDTDGDGISDGIEFNQGTDPNN